MKRKAKIEARAFDGPAQYEEMVGELFRRASPMRVGALNHWDLTKLWVFLLEWPAFYLWDGRRARQDGHTALGFLQSWSESHGYDSLELTAYFTFLEKHVDQVLRRAKVIPGDGLSWFVHERFIPVGERFLPWLPKCGGPSKQERDGFIRGWNLLSRIIARLAAEEPTTEEPGRTFARADAPSTGSKELWSLPMSKADMQRTLRFNTRKQFESYAKAHGIKNDGTKKLWSLNVADLDPKIQAKFF